MLKEDRRGVFGIILFFVVLFTILIIGIIGVVLISSFDFASDTITPIMKDLGVVGDTNFSQVSDYTFGTMDRVVQAMPWVFAFIYVMMLVFSIILVVSYRESPHPIFIIIYFFLALLLIVGSIILSNTYQDLYNSNDSDIGNRIRSQTTMSFLIIHSPIILTTIVFIVGIYLFTSNKENYGGFDV
jgi:hypothetical protein